MKPYYVVTSLVVFFLFLVTVFVAYEAIDNGLGFHQEYVAPTNQQVSINKYQLICGQFEWKYNLDANYLVKVNGCTKVYRSTIWVTSSGTVTVTPLNGTKVALVVPSVIIALGVFFLIWNIRNLPGQIRWLSFQLPAVLSAIVSGVKASLLGILRGSIKLISFVLKQLSNVLDKLSDFGRAVHEWFDWTNKKKH